MTRERPHFRSTMSYLALDSLLILKIAAQYAILGRPAIISVRELIARLSSTGSERHSHLARGRSVGRSAGDHHHHYWRIIALAPADEEHTQRRVARSGSSRSKSHGQFANHVALARDLPNKSANDNCYRCCCVKNRLNRATEPACWRDHYRFRCPVLSSQFSILRSQFSRLQLVGARRIIAPMRQRTHFRTNQPGNSLTPADSLERKMDERRERQSAGAAAPLL